jgi:hypothetical protein
MNAEQLRTELKKFYPKSENWARKVDKMNPAQLFAIYTKLRNRKN